MRHTHAREAARIAVLAIVIFSPAALSLLAEGSVDRLRHGSGSPSKRSAKQEAVRNQHAQEPQRFPDLVGALQRTPGCLGVEAGSMASGKQVIFAWFEDKKAVLNWYYSDVHQQAMRAFAPQSPKGRPPLAEIAENSGPILAIASITPSNTSAVDGVKLPVSQIAIELYAPLPGGVSAGGRFAPATVKVPGQSTVSTPSERTSIVTVRVRGVSSTKGQIRIAMYRAEETWLKDGSAAYSTVMEANSGDHQWRIDKVPYGRYAVAVYYDEDRDGRLNRNTFGMPTEPYGFSNNAKGVFGPASWKDSSFEVTDKTTDVVIELQ